MHNIDPTAVYPMLSRQSSSTSTTAATAATSTLSRQNSFTSRSSSSRLMDDGNSSQYRPRTTLSRQSSRSSTISTTLTNAATVATSTLSRQNSTASRSSRVSEAPSSSVWSEGLGRALEDSRELEEVRRENEALRNRILELERELRRVEAGERRMGTSDEREIRLERHATFSDTISVNGDC